MFMVPVAAIGAAAITKYYYDKKGFTTSKEPKVVARKKIERPTSKTPLPVVNKQVIKPAVPPGFSIEILHHDIPDLKDMETMMSEYSFIVNTDKVSSMTNGWTIDIASKQVLELCTPGGKADNKTWFVVALVGEYSTGKSHFITGCAAARAKDLGTVESKRNIREARLYGIQEGFGATTSGFSGVFAGGDGQNIKTADCLLLDTAGKNPPVKREGSESTESIEQEFNEARASERLMEHVTVDISDVIVYLMDGVRNADQRSIMNILHQIKDQPQKKLCIVHNFKRLTPDAPGKDDLIQQQIVAPFDAKRVPQDKLTRSIGGDVQVPVWRSTWIFEDKVGQQIVKKRVEIDHFVLYNEDDEAGKRENFAVYNYFMITLGNNAKKVVGSPITAIAQSLANHLDKYVREKEILPDGWDASSSGNGEDDDEDDGLSIDEDAQTNDNDQLFDPAPNSKQGPATESEKTYPVASMVLRVPTRPNHVLDIFNWRIVDGPVSYCQGEFTPPFSRYIAQSLVKDENDRMVSRECDFSRLDLVGIPKEALILGDFPDSFDKTQPFIRISSRDLGPSEFCYIVEGYRPKEENDPSSNTYGKFKVQIPVAMRFNGPSQVIFEDGVLLIKTPHIPRDPLARVNVGH